jgi:transcriptional regulator with XRE-family HTH domain
MSLGEKLRRMREDRDISQLEFANKMHVCHSHISKIEHDVKKPSVELLKRIADYFEVSIDWLLGNYYMIRLIPCFCCSS